MTPAYLSIQRDNLQGSYGFKEIKMESSSVHALWTNPELKSLYEISMIPPDAKLQDYFLGVMATLSKFFPVSYAALISVDMEKDVLHLEALYGMEKELHPHRGPAKKGVMGEVFQSRLPGVIQNIREEPFYREMAKRPDQAEWMKSPLLCAPLIGRGVPIGVMMINPLYGVRNTFNEDLHFLSLLSAIISPAIQNYHLKNMETQEGSKRTKLKTGLLEEILEERLTEFLNKIDPYVESKNRTGLLSDVVSLVEKILIKLALEKVGHVQTSASQLLGINRNTLRTKMKAYKIKSR